MFKKVLLKLLVVLVLVGGMVPVFIPAPVKADGPISINHDTDDITQIPQYWINKAKTDLHIGYGRQSHGAQLTRGMTGLVNFANNGGLGLGDMPDNIYDYSNGDTGGTKLDIEQGGSLTDWLKGTAGTTPTDYGGYGGYWADETRRYLDDPGHDDVNVIIWSWCWELIYRYQRNEIQPHYLDAMSDLETDYPNVTFVYMTAHVPDHAEVYGGPDDPADYAENTAANDMIRTYFNNDTHTNKALYDFADIESYNPDNVHYDFPAVNCDYYSSAADTEPDGNWATEWQGTHTQGVDWFPWPGSNSTGEELHTYPLNANLKAYAAWWLWARLADWDGTPNSAPVSNAQTVSTGEDTAKAITLTATDDDGDVPYLTYSVTNPAHGDLSGTAPNLTYTPDPGYSGGDSFTFTTNDGHLDSNEATVSITVGSASVISITITDAGTEGVNFGSQNPAADCPDTDADGTTASIIVKVEPDTTVNVDLQIKGTDFSNGSGGSIVIANAKYSLAYAGDKVTMSTTYTDFATDVVKDTSTSLWHWLTIPAGTAAGAYTSTFSYKAEAH